MRNWLLVVNLILGEKLTLAGKPDSRWGTWTNSEAHLISLDLITSEVKSSLQERFGLSVCELFLFSVFWEWFLTDEFWKELALYSTGFVQNWTQILGVKLGVKIDAKIGCRKWTKNLTKECVILVRSGREREMSNKSAFVSLVRNRIDYEVSGSNIRNFK